VLTLEATPKGAGGEQTTQPDNPLKETEILQKVNSEKYNYDICHL
jgi:hypothetical protein